MKNLIWNIQTGNLLCFQVGKERVYAASNAFGKRAPSKYVTTKIWFWSCWWSNISNISENRSETVIVSLCEVEICAWWNSKFCTRPFERWRVTVIIYLVERWVVRKSWFTLISFHLKGILLKMRYMWNIRSDLIFSGRTYKYRVQKKTWITAYTRE